MEGSDLEGTEHRKVTETTSRKKLKIGIQKVKQKWPSPHIQNVVRERSVEDITVCTEAWKDVFMALEETEKIKNRRAVIVSVKTNLTTTIVSHFLILA